jgi:hypothetical protein
MKEPTSEKFEFTDPPAHLSLGGGSIGWHLVIADGQLEVATGVVDADVKIIADYPTALVLARATHAEIAANPEIAGMASRLHCEGDITQMAKLTWMAPIHDLLTACTR